jgi:uncharacterized damage-inducible protein DinB
MALKDALLPEFDHEMGTTRRLLERVPQSDFAWKPHEKSYTLGELAGHVAFIPHWIDLIADADQFDVSTLSREARARAPESAERLLQTFDANAMTARRRIDELGDSALTARWTLRNGTHAIFSMPRAAVIRNLVMNHLIHHRGQLSVYLRLRSVPLPPLYGPTADEQ